MKHKAHKRPHSGGTATRIPWREFVGTGMYLAMQQLLSIEGYHLVVVFDKNKVSKDAFITRR